MKNLNLNPSQIYNPVMAFVESEEQSQTEQSTPPETPKEEQTPTEQSTPPETPKEIKDARITLLTYANTARKLQYIINKQAINKRKGEKKPTLSNVIEGLINQYIEEHAADLEGYTEPQPIVKEDKK